MTYHQTRLCSCGFSTVDDVESALAHAAEHPEHTFTVTLADDGA